MSFGAYLANIYTQLGLICLIVTFAFSWWRGGAAERQGSMMLLLVWLAADLLRGLNGQLMPTVLLFGSDVLLATGFLYLALRYSSLWLGLAMMCQAFAFALHALQMGDSDAPRWHGMIVYLLLNNILSYLLLLILFIGTLATAVQKWRETRTRAEPRGRPFGTANHALTILQPPFAGSF